MNTQNSRLVFRDYPLFNCVVGIFFLVLAATYIPYLLKGASAANTIFVILEVGIGLFLILWGSILTVIADRTTQILTIGSRSILRGSKKEIPFAEIDAVQLEMGALPRHSSRSSGPTYRIVVVRKDGQTIPFHSYYSSGTGSKMKQVEKLRAFLGVGGTDPGFGLRAALQYGSQIAQQEYQKQQETLTGSEVEEHLTDGIHWKVQTVIFGGTPVTRWFSPDFQMPGGFLYLAQKVEGQGSSSGGPLAGLSKILYRQSMNIYGFSGEDTPGAANAEALSPLDPGLEPYFTAYTSDSGTARQNLNPWVVAPLADWATRYPLKKLQGRGIFGQLAVMFSPRGVYVASMGTMIPEALEELTNLGVALVKAQGSISNRPS
jgi:hypothetical protein